MRLSVDVEGRFTGYESINQHIHNTMYIKKNHICKKEFLELDFKRTSLFLGEIRIIDESILREGFVLQMANRQNKKMNRYIQFESGLVYFTLAYLNFKDIIF